MTLSTHETSPNNNDYSNEEMMQVIRRNIKLARFSNAWTLCQVRSIYSHLSNKRDVTPTDFRKFHHAQAKTRQKQR